jgi:hypothetical protein
MLRRMRRAPTFVVALCAAVVELVLVAAAGNQWTVDHLIKKSSADELPRTHQLKTTLTAFPWRWTPESQQRMLWLGEVVAVLGLVIAVFVLMYALVGPMRPPRSFLSVFVGTWGVVFALTQVAAIGRVLIAYSDLFKDQPGGRDPDRLGRFWYSLFDGPTSYTVLFGAVSGLIVAIVAGCVAAATSRRVDDEDDLDPALSSDPDDIPDWSAALGSTQMYGGGSWGSRTGEPPRSYDSDSDSTRTLGSDSDSTQAFRPSNPTIGEPTQTIGSSSERTSSLPPPNPADRLSGWPAPESPAQSGSIGSSTTSRLSGSSATSGPAPAGSAQRPDAPTAAQPSGAAWNRPARPRGDQWSSVTESGAGQIPVVPVEPDDPPTETTLPRAPRPTSELPRPGTIPESGRLPLPEEHGSGS